MFDFCARNRAVTAQGREFVFTSRCSKFEYPSELFLQAGEVKSGSHGLQQQPVLQGQPIPLQVEYKTA